MNTSREDVRHQEALLDAAFMDAYPGDACVVIGGGPSVAGVVPYLAGPWKLIGVNASVYRPEFVHLWDLYAAGVMLDSEVLRDRARTIVNRIPFPLFTGNTRADSQDVFGLLNAIGIFRIPSNHTEGLGDSFGRFANGGNSGFAAVQLAVIMGFRIIGIVGFDGGCTGHHLHFHNDYEGRPANRQRFAEWCRMLDRYAPLFASLGVAIINLGDASALSAYTTCNITELPSLMKCGHEVIMKDVRSACAPLGPVTRATLPFELYEEADVGDSSTGPTCYSGAVNAALSRRHRPLHPRLRVLLE